MNNTQNFNQNNGPLYLLEDVWVEFDTQVALKNIHLKINPQEMIFLTGSSGAGKTTLLKVLGDQQKISRGSLLNSNVEFGGDKNVTTKKSKQSNQSNQLNQLNPFSSMVFQDLKLLDYLTGYENLWAAYDPRIFPKEEDFNKDLQEYSRFFGIHNKLHQKSSTYNGGLKQKFAIIRALLARPQIVLADEPTSALDRESTIKLYELFTFLNQKYKITIIWASHNRELVKKFNGRIIHLDAGKLVYTGQTCFI